MGNLSDTLKDKRTEAFMTDIDTGNERRVRIRKTQYAPKGVMKVVESLDKFLNPEEADKELYLGGLLNNPKRKKE